MIEHGTRRQLLNKPRNTSQGHAQAREHPTQPKSRLSPVPTQLFQSVLAQLDGNSVLVDDSSVEFSATESEGFMGFEQVKVGAF